MNAPSIATTLALGLIAITLAACDPEAPDMDAQDRGEWSSLGKADGIATCEDACGDQAPAGCWCDDLCEDYGDCCDDKAEVCDCEPLSCEELGACGEVDDGCGSTLDCGACAPAACLPETNGWGPMQSLVATGTITKVGDPSDTTTATLSLEGYGALDCLERESCWQTQVNGALVLASGTTAFSIAHAPNQDRRAHWGKSPDGEVRLSARTASGTPGPTHPGCPRSWLTLENQPGTSELVGSILRYAPWHGGCEPHRWDVELTMDDTVSCLP
jgi:hypothetical protein